MKAVNEKQEYYMKYKLINCELGTRFFYGGTEWELVYNVHAIMVGLTVEEYEGSRQAKSFSDLDTVLVNVNSINNE